MTSQPEHYGQSRQYNADINNMFIKLVTCGTKPLTREDLQANINRNPEIWKRFKSWLDKLPSNLQSPYVTTVIKMDSAGWRIIGKFISTQRYAQDVHPHRWDIMFRIRF